MAANQSLAFPQRVTFWQIVDEIVGAGGNDDDGDERRAQYAVSSGHVLKRAKDLLRVRPFVNLRCIQCYFVDIISEVPKINS